MISELDLVVERGMSANIGDRGVTDRASSAVSGLVPGFGNAGLELVYLGILMLAALACT